ncbi:MAG: hypothetical protein LBV26_06950, partial [Bacteroidales bacterium]|nr:hypothetical protein [Bacteroidales bacterium]
QGCVFWLFFAIKPLKKLSKNISSVNYPPKKYCSYAKILLFLHSGFNTDARWTCWVGKQQG